MMLLNVSIHAKNIRYIKCLTNLNTMVFFLTRFQQKTIKTLLLLKFVGSEQKTVHIINSSYNIMFIRNNRREKTI